MSAERGTMDSFIAADKEKMLLLGPVKDGLVTAAQAATILDRSVTHVFELLAANTLKRVLVKGESHIDYEEVMAYRSASSDSS